MKRQVEELQAERAAEKRASLLADPAAAAAALEAIVADIAANEKLSLSEARLRAFERDGGLARVADRACPANNR